MDIAETEVGRLRDELWQSSDKETSVLVQARKALKEMQDKLQGETAAHQRTGEALNQRLDAEGQAERKILEMWEDAKKQKQ